MGSCEVGAVVFSLVSVFGLALWSFQDFFLCSSFRGPESF